MRSTGHGLDDQVVFAIMSVVQAINSPLCPEAATVIDRMRPGGQERSSSALTGLCSQLESWADAKDIVFRI